MKVIYVNWAAWGASSPWERSHCGSGAYVDRVAESAFVAGLERRRARMRKAATLSPAVDAWCRRHGRSVNRTRTSSV